MDDKLPDQIFDNIFDRTYFVPYTDLNADEGWGQGLRHEGTEWVPEWANRIGWVEGDSYDDPVWTYVHDNTDWPFIRDIVILGAAHGRDY